MGSFDPVNVGCFDDDGNVEGCTDDDGISVSDGFVLGLSETLGRDETDGIRLCEWTLVIIISANRWRTTIPMILLCCIGVMIGLDDFMCMINS